MAIKSGSRKGNKIEWIVIHYPVAPGKSAEWLYKYYYNTSAIKSAHFAVDERGAKKIVNLEKAAYHCATCDRPVYCAANNRNSIGIDLMEDKIDKTSRKVEDLDWYIPEKTLSNAAELIAKLALDYKIEESHIVRHYDVTRKWCPRPLIGYDTNKYYGITGEDRWKMFKKQIHDEIFRQMDERILNNGVEFVK